MRRFAGGGEGGGAIRRGSWDTAAAPCGKITMVWYVNSSDSWRRIEILLGRMVDAGNRRTDTERFSNNKLALETYWASTRHK